MRRGLTQPGWRPEHTYSVTGSLVMAVGAVGLIMLSLVALSSPIVVVGFGVGLVVRPAIRAARAISRRGSQALRRLWTEATVAAALRRGVWGR